MFWKFLLLVFFISCSTKPTHYQKLHKDEGYADREEDDIKVSIFKANSVTKAEKAKLYAEFHAVETCRGRGQEHTNILDIFDRSQKKDVVKTNTTSPMYYGGYGMYPYYSRYSGFGMGMSMGIGSATSWNETYVYPVMEVYYTCGAPVLRPMMIFKEIKADEMKHLVKDIKGGIQVEKIMPGSPNINHIKEGDIILKAAGKRIEKVYHLIHLFDKKHQSFKVELLREGVKKSLLLRSNDVTEKSQSAEHKIIDLACQEKEIQTHGICKS